MAIESLPENTRTIHSTMGCTGTNAIARARYYDGFQDEVMRGFSEYIENVIAALSKSVVEISGINNTLQAICGKILRAGKPTDAADNGIGRRPETQACFEWRTQRFQ
ncbi:MAG: hypothetical protein R3E54_03740 [Halioglobus sp.]